MKTIFIRIIFCFCIVVSINACQTIQHKKNFVNNVNKNTNEILQNNKNKKSKFSVKNSVKSNDMAPINLPKQTDTVQKLVLQKQLKIPNSYEFSFDKFINWHEEELVKALGKSDFVKEEGKLKNYQYHFKECFIDVFLLKKNRVYLVNYIEQRPTKLNGKINIKACFEEIKQILN